MAINADAIAFSVAIALIAFIRLTIAIHLITIDIN